MESNEYPTPETSKTAGSSNRNTIYIRIAVVICVLIGGAAMYEHYSGETSNTGISEADLYQAYKQKSEARTPLEKFRAFRAVLKAGHESWMDYGYFLYQRRFDQFASSPVGVIGIVQGIILFIVILDCWIAAYRIFGLTLVGVAVIIITPGAIAIPTSLLFDMSGNQSIYKYWIIAGALAFSVLILLLKDLTNKRK